MARSPAPLFLARGVYRRRRLRDAARLLPLVGAFFLLLPVLWGGPRGAGWDAVFIFAVWVLLIGGAALLAPKLADPERPEGDAPTLDATAALAPKDGG